MKERRAARRYKLSLPFEIRPVSTSKELQPNFFETKDISSLGFYFESDQDFPVGSKFNFMIIFAQEIADGAPELVNGLARTVRLVKTPEERFGVGILIESYKISAQ